MATQAYYDELDNPKTMTFENVYYGQVSLEARPVVLVKGLGKVDFDPAVHAEDQKRMAVEVEIATLTEMNLSFVPRRETIASASDWVLTMLPSIKVLGVTSMQMNGTWAKVRTVPQKDWNGNPMTYTARDGSTKERTTFEFAAIYPNEAACRAAYQAEKGGGATPVTQYQGQASQAAAQPAQPTPAAPGDTQSKEYKVALSFLKPIVVNACRGQSDPDVIRNILALNLSLNPTVGKFFTADSPEVATLIVENMK